METDLYFACSSEGEEQTNKMIQAIKTKAQNLPVENAQQIAGNLETSYKGVFNCEANIQKALQMGFTKNEIDSAIERSKKRKAKNSEESSIDFEAFERDLDIIFSKM